MEITDAIKISGSLHLEIVNKYGVVTDVYDFDNLITNVGYLVTAQAIAGVAGVGINRVAVGTSSTSPNSNNTSITNAVYVNVKSVEYPAPTRPEIKVVVVFNFEVDYLVAVGMNIYEFGLITQDNRLFSRWTRALIQKTNEMKLVGRWTVNL